MKLLNEQFVYRWIELFSHYERKIEIIGKEKLVGKNWKIKKD